MRRIERVRPCRTDLVGARQDDDRVDRRRMGDRVVHERLEEPCVAVMQVAHQVQHGVGIGRSLDAGIEQRRHRARRRALVRRPETRRIDQRHRFELGRWPADLDPLDAVDAVLAEVDRQLAVLAPERQVDAALGPQVGAHAVPEAVPVPRHDLGALAGVRGRQPLADQGVEQRRLAGLHPTGDRDAQRLVESARDRVDRRDVAGPSGRLPSEIGDRPDIGRQIAHRDIRVRTGCRRSCRCPGRPNGPPWRRGRRSAVRRSAAR